MSASHLCGLHEPAAQAGLSCRFAAIHLLQTLVNPIIWFSRPPQGKTKCKQVSPLRPLPENSLKPEVFSPSRKPARSDEAASFICTIELLVFAIHL